MSVKYVINPKYENTLKNFILNIEDYFKQNQQTIHKARNEIKIIDFQNKKFVVKSFKKPSALKAIYYTKNSSKAKRSYEYSLKLGEFAPEPIGYIEFYEDDKLSDSYYVSEYFEYDYTIKEPLRTEGFENKEEGKGQYLVIEAIEKLKDLNIKAMVVGHTMDEEYLESLKEKSKQLDIENKIIFTGFTKEVNEHMQLFDANILATPKETFGLVVIEAMANKVCMIATNAGGPLEIIEDNIDGLLFNRTSEDLANKIKKLYENSDFRKQIALKGYKKAKEKFDKQTQLNKLYRVINES
jgi:glycosyltransferase involved in cell wall biosynthesis